MLGEVALDARTNVFGDNSNRSDSVNGGKRTEVVATIVVHLPVTDHVLDPEKTLMARTTDTHLFWVGFEDRPDIWKLTPDEIAGPLAAYDAWRKRLF